MAEQLDLWSRGRTGRGPAELYYEKGWQWLLDLFEEVKDDDPSKQCRAMDIIVRICQNSPTLYDRLNDDEMDDEMDALNDDEMDDEMDALNDDVMAWMDGWNNERDLVRQNLLPKLLEATKSPTPEVRSMALTAINVFTSRKSEAMLDSIDSLLQHLFHLQNDESPNVRQQVYSAFAYLVESYPDKLQPHISGLAKHIISQQKDVVCQAAGFWLSIGRHENLYTALGSHIQEIIPVLLGCMEKDIALLRLENDEDDEDGVTIAKALGVFAQHFGDPVVKCILPYLDTNLMHENGSYRRSAVLALGAVACGCRAAVTIPKLPEWMLYLITILLNDSEPLIRQATCWSLGQYSDWAADKDNLLAEGILATMLDKDKRVQKAAASALYNYVRTLAKRRSSDLVQPDLVNKLMPALTKRYSEVKNNSPELFPLLRCLLRIAKALKDDFAPYAQPIFERSVKLSDYLGAKEEVLLMNLELQRISTLGLKGKVTDPAFFEQLSELLDDPSSSKVQGAAFKLLGDYVSHKSPLPPEERAWLSLHLISKLSSVFGLYLIASQDGEPLEDILGSVRDACACAEKVRGDLKDPYIDELLPKHTDIILKPDGSQKLLDALEALSKDPSVATMFATMEIAESMKITMQRCSLCRQQKTWCDPEHLGLLIRELESLSPDLSKAYEKCTTTTLIAFSEGADEAAGYVALLCHDIDKSFFEKIGYFLGVINSCAILGRGDENNPIIRALKAQDTGEIPDQVIDLATEMTASKQLQDALFLANQFHDIILRRFDSVHILPYIHVILIFVYYLSYYPAVMDCFIPTFPWKLLSLMLNTLLVGFTSHSLIESEDFPQTGQAPLPEDYGLRHLPWVRNYHPPELFVGDKTAYRNLCSIDTERVIRILWLGVRLARKGNYLRYDPERQFSVTPQFEEWLYEGGEDSNRVR